MFIIGIKINCNIFKQYKIVFSACSFFRRWREPGITRSPKTDGIDGDPDENAAPKSRNQGKVGEQGVQGETGAKSVLGPILETMV